MSVFHIFGMQKVICRNYRIEDPGALNNVSDSMYCLAILQTDIAIF